MPGLENNQAFTTSDRICLNICVRAFPQVTEQMMDEANEKKMAAIDALGEGRLFRKWTVHADTVSVLIRWLSYDL